MQHAGPSMGAAGGTGRPAAGFSLVEVAVASALLTVGLLAVASAVQASRRSLDTAGREMQVLLLAEQALDVVARLPYRVREDAAPAEGAVADLFEGRTLADGRAADRPDGVDWIGALPEGFSAYGLFLLARQSGDPVYTRHLDAQGRALAAAVPGGLSIEVHVTNDLSAGLAAPLSAFDPFDNSHTDGAGGQRARALLVEVRHEGQRVLGTLRVDPAWLAGAGS